MSSSTLSLLARHSCLSPKWLEFSTRRTLCSCFVYNSETTKAIYIKEGHLANLDRGTVHVKQACSMIETLLWVHYSCGHTEPQVNKVPMSPCNSMVFIGPTQDMAPPVRRLFTTASHAGSLSRSKYVLFLLLFLTYLQPWEHKTSARKTT